MTGPGVYCDTRRESRLVTGCCHDVATVATGESEPSPAPGDKRSGGELDDERAVVQLRQPHQAA